MSSRKHTLPFRQPLKAVTVEHWGPPAVPAAEVEEALEAAQEKGRRDTAAFHAAQLSEQRQEMVHHQQQVLQGLEQKVEQLVEALNDQLPALVVNLTEQVLAGVQFERAQLLGLITEVLKDYQHHEGEQLEISLSTDDHAQLQNFQGDPQLPFKRLSFQEDPALSSGDIVVRSRYGLLDARLSTKLNQIRQQLGLS